MKCYRTLLVPVAATDRSWALCDPLQERGPSRTAVRVFKFVGQRDTLGPWLHYLQFLPSTQ